MAYKSAAEVLLAWQEFVNLADDIQSACTTFETNYVAALDAINPDTVEAGPENAIQSAMLDAVKNRMGDAFNAAKALVDSIHYSLGRLAGSPDIFNKARNLAKFEDYLVSNSKELESLGLTKFSSLSAGGSNVGNGKFFVYGSNPQGEVLDIAHPQTLTLICSKDSFSAQNRKAEGNESFRIEGEESDTAFPWNLAGSGIGPGFQYRSYGLGTNEFSAGQKLVGRDGEIPVVSGAQSNGNLIRGDFETSFTAPTANEQSFVDGWTVTTGYDKISWDSTIKIKGNGSLKLTGNCKFRYPLSGLTNLSSKSILVLDVMSYKFINSGTLTGTLTVKVIDDSTTHSTLTVTVGALSDNTKTQATPVVVVLPSSIGANLRVEVEVASYSASDAANYLVIDEVVLGPTYLVDGGYLIAIVGGLTPFRKDDSASGATTSTEGGRLQYYANLNWERSFRHAGTADFWEDPA